MLVAKTLARAEADLTTLIMAPMFPGHCSGTSPLLQEFSNSGNVTVYEPMMCPKVFAFNTFLKRNTRLSLWWLLQHLR